MDNDKIWTPSSASAGTPVSKVDNDDHRLRIVGIQEMKKTSALLGSDGEPQLRGAATTCHDLP